MGQHAWSCETAFDEARRRRRFNHVVATDAGELRPNVANDLEALRWDVLELLRNIFAELPQLAAAIYFAGEMFRQRLAFRSCLQSAYSRARLLSGCDRLEVQRPSASA